MKLRWQALARLAAAGSWVALACHLVGDLTLPTAIVSYALPWLVLGLVGGSLLPVLKGRWRLGALPALGFGLWGCTQSFNFAGTPVDPGRPVFQAMTWNAGRQLAGHPEWWKFPADVVVITEAGDLSAVWNLFRQATPGLTWRRLDTGILLGVRGRLGETKNFGVHDRFRCSRVPVRLRSGAELDVIAVDIHSQPWLSRKPSLDGIFHEAARDRPTLVMGDFNTPIESRLLGRATGDRFQCANTGAHAGFRESWPWMIPLLTLDQIWSDRRMPAVECRSEGRSSDHRAVLARLSVPRS
ncbi:endonuclease/exonuclease/phosphatase family protein [Haloferula sargassicola]|uniref:Endonuclease/exonuclease/phosphatase domain-containing protein n=1 Tax=Haloferula sargassicola TaxID=490096 RepID=A0ABP9UN53_9BACT